MAESHETTGGTLQCIVVTPETTILDEPAEFVAVPLYDGELGIAAGHTPLLGRLGYGELRIRKGASLQRFYVDGGFVEVVDDVVTVLTNNAMPADQVDPAVAAERLSAALARPAHTPELMEIRDRVVAQSRAQLRIARHGE